MQFARISAGDIVGHQMKIEGQACLVVEGPNGEAFGVIRGRPKEQPAKRGESKTDGTIFESADGSWFVPHQQHWGEDRRPVLDSAGTEIGSIEMTSHSARTFHVPGGAVSWERHIGRPQYRIDGHFGVSRSGLHAFAAGVSKKPFKGAITEALASRADGSLVLLLASSAAMGSIDAKVSAATSTG
jgi:hypothetical protein